MGHCIEDDDTLATYGKSWHGLGTVLDAPPQTWEEMLRVSGLDWEVELHPVLADIAGTGPVAIPDTQAVVRMTDHKGLGVVGTKYKPIQNRESGQFLDELPTVGAMEYHTAGSLRGGRDIWVLGKLTGQEIEVLPGDLTESFILARNTHDGTGSFRVFATTVRVVCNNTLRLALTQGAGTGLAIRHLGNIRDHLKEAQRVLGFATKEVEQYRELCDYLKTLKFSAKKTEKFVHDLLPGTKSKDESGKEVEKISGKVKVQREKILELVESGEGTDIKGVRGTGYGILQAVTEYSSHYMTVRGVGREGTRDELASKRGKLRLQGAFFGSGDRLNQKARKLLVPA